jgi:hypothetical protein
MDDSGHGVVFRYLAAVQCIERVCNCFRFAVLLIIRRAVVFYIVLDVFDTQCGFKSF